MSQDVMVSVRDVCAAMGVEYTGSIADCLKQVYELSLRKKAPDVSRQQLERYRKALEPFAREAPPKNYDLPDTYLITGMAAHDECRITVGDLRHAAAVLKESEDE